MSRKVYIGSVQYGLLKESEWNFHFGKGHNGKPYISDNKYQMLGRETGHFGSGTYFSTYRGMYDNRSGEISSRNDVSNMNPNFIEIDGGLYRVDFDLYKNLYRVHSKRQGDILYTMLRNLNVLYNRITCSSGSFNPSVGEYDNARFYQVIRKNADALGLRCPSYYELVRMAQRHEGIQSFSTLFMEWNGFNGVNVSGIDYYDNTKHGSVIYDLSKVDTEMEELRPKSMYCGYKDSSYDDTIARDGFDDAVVDTLRGDFYSWEKLNDMPLADALRLLKNYTDSGNVLNYFELKRLNSELIKRYLRLVFVKNPMSRWGDPVLDEIVHGDKSRYYAELIDEYGAYYWVNYEPRGGRYYSMLVNLLSNFSWNIPYDVEIDDERRMKDEYLRKLMSYMERDLTEYEKDYIREDYFDEGYENVSI